MQPLGLAIGRCSRGALACLLIGASGASAQRAEPAVARVVVLGQPDSRGMRLAERLIDELTRADSSHRVAIMPFRDIKATYERSLDVFGDVFRFPDMWELGRILRADVVIGLVPETAARPRRVNVMVARSARAHFVGSFVLGSVDTTAQNIASRVRKDTTYVHAIADKHHEAVP